VISARAVASSYIGIGWLRNGEDDPDPEKILQDFNPDNFEENKKVYKKYFGGIIVENLILILSVRNRIWNKKTQKLQPNMKTEAGFSFCLTNASSNRFRLRSTTENSCRFSLFLTNDRSSTVIIIPPQSLRQTKGTFFSFRLLHVFTKRTR
jgi:hypothetical protein